MLRLYKGCCFAPKYVYVLTFANNFDTKFTSRPDIILKCWRLLKECFMDKVSSSGFSVVSSASCDIVCSTHPTFIPLLICVCPNRYG